MIELNQERFERVVQQAFDEVPNSRPWQTAIAKAKRQLEENPYTHWQGDALLILSDSNTIYTANGTCQCKAYSKGQPCWHRAAARRVQRYLETSH